MQSCGIRTHFTETVLSADTCHLWEWISTAAPAALELTSNIYQLLKTRSLFLTPTCSCCTTHSSACPFVPVSISEPLPADGFCLLNPLQLQTWFWMIDKILLSLLLLFTLIQKSQFIPSTHSAPPSGWKRLLHWLRVWSLLDFPPDLISDSGWFKGTWWSFWVFFLVLLCYVIGIIVVIFTLF